ncbi:cytochrome P450, partial [Streptomyces sp. NPDC004976]
DRRGARRSHGSGPAAREGRHRGAGAAGAPGRGPFLGGLAARDLYWRGEWVPAGGLVVLDVYGQNHDESLWGDPYAFRPGRFLQRPVQRDELIPQGGGEPSSGHRCPGEGITVGVLEALAGRLARMEYTVPEQNLAIPLNRVPTRPHSGVLLAGVRPAAG